MQQRQNSLAFEQMAQAQESPAQASVLRFTIAAATSRAAATAQCIGPLAWKDLFNQFRAIVCKLG